MDDGTATAKASYFDKGIEARSHKGDQKLGWISDARQAEAPTLDNFHVRSRRQPNVRSLIERRFTRMNEEHDRIRSRELALRLASNELKRNLLV